MPSFVAAWLFFTLRREAWLSAPRAGAIAAAAAVVGVLLHDRVLTSSFYDDAPLWTLPSRWVASTLHFDGATALNTGSLMPVYLATVVGVSLAAVAFQQWATAERRALTGRVKVRTH